MVIGAALLCAVLMSACDSGALKGSVSVYLHLYAQPADEILSSLLEEFDSQHPALTISPHVLPYQDMKRLLLENLKQEDRRGEDPDQDEDQVIVTVLTGGDLAHPDIQPLIQEFRPWQRTDWQLYYDTERLSAAGWDQKRLEAAVNKGLEKFIEELLPALNEGESVFVLGADFFWPWLAWIEHLEALSRNGRVPGDYDVASWERGLSAWQRLSEKPGVFNRDYRTMNMASAQLGIRGGKGLFVLSDPSAYRVYPPEQRRYIAGVTFPGADNWQIGTSFFLALLDPALKSGDKRKNDSLKAGDAVRKYLHGDTVTGRVLSSTGIFLLPITRDSAFLPKREIPSITQNVRDPDLQPLLKYLEKPE